MDKIENTKECSFIIDAKRNKMENYVELKEKSSLRKKADDAKKMRCSTLICVLENPKNINNVSAIIRNIDALGIGKLYIIDGFNLLPKGHWKESMRNDKNLNNVSVSAIKWTYVRRFDTTKSCIDHIIKNGFVSMVTSPHLKGKDNFDLHEGKAECACQFHLASNEFGEFFTSIKFMNYIPIKILDKLLYYLLH